MEITCASAIRRSLKASNHAPCDPPSVTASASTSTRTCAPARTELRGRLHACMHAGRWRGDAHVLEGGVHALAGARDDCMRRVADEDHTLALVQSAHVHHLHTHASRAGRWR